MKCLRILLLFLLLLSAFAGQAAMRTVVVRNPKAIEVQQKSSPEDDPVLTELISLERLMFTAQQNGDREALERLLAADFTWKDVVKNRKLNRAKLLEQVKVDHSIKDFECHNYRLKFEGATAVISGECAYDLQGDHLRERFTDRWVKKDGEWQIVSGETMLVPNKR